MGGQAEKAESGTGNRKYWEIFENVYKAVFMELYDQLDEGQGRGRTEKNLNTFLRNEVFIYLFNSY